MGLALITAPTVEPITTAELKAHSHIDSSSEDSYLDTLISAGRRSAENFCRRAFIHQTWELSMDLEPGLQILRLPLPRLSSVTSIKWYDEADTETLYAATNYRVDSTDDYGGRIALKDGHVWPSGLRYTNGLVIRYVAGYGATAADVPADIKHAIKLLAAHWYENREPVNVGNIVNEIPLGGVGDMVKHLLYPYRVLRF